MHDVMVYDTHLFSYEPLPIYSMVLALTGVSGLEKEEDFDPSLHSNSELPDPDQPISVTISQFGQTLYPIAIDYSFRSKLLDHIPLYLYKRFLEKVPLNRAVFHFLKGHPQQGTHGLRLRSHLIIPNLFFTIPSAHSDDPVRKHTYASVIFILFHPWRNLASDFAAFSLEPFLTSCSPLIAQLVSNVNLLASSKKEAQLLAALRESDKRKLPIVVNAALDQNDGLMDEELGDILGDLGTASWTDSFSMDQLDHSVSLEHDAFTQDLVTRMSNWSQLPPPSTSSTQFDTEYQLPFQAPFGPAWKEAFDDLASGVMTPDHPIIPSNESTPSLGSRRLEPYNACLKELGDRRWIHSSHTIIDRLRIDMAREPNSETSSTCPLDAVLTDFNLNQEQTLATKLVGYKLLGHLDQLPRSSNVSPSTPSDPLRLFISGEGGTGKSHVIRAIKHLFEHFLKSKALFCMAPTGVAAYNINASTIHSAFGFNLNTSQPSLTPEFIDKMSTRFRDVLFLLIDEISMVPASLMRFMDRVLRAIRNPDLPFGGIHLITLGDFCQLAPVAQAPLYADIAASELWHPFTAVIILKQQMRASSDPAFRALLNRSRAHQNTREDFDVLKGRILNSPQQIPNTADWLNATIIVTRKNAAFALNLMRLRSFCAATSVSEVVFPATDMIQGMEITSARVRTNIVDLEKTGVIKPKLPRSLHLAIGAKVSLTCNLKTEIGLVNGAEGTIADILLVPDTITHRSDSASNCIFLDRPPIILFRPNDPHPALRSYTFTGLEHYPPGLVPIVSVERNYRAEIYAGSLQRMNVTRHQLPLTLSYAITDYKAQGRSLTHAFLDLKAPPGKRDANSFYVMLSRLTSLSGLRLLRDFDPIKLMVPLPLPLAAELDRLATLDLSS